MPQPIRVFEHRSSRHLAGCAEATMGMGISGAILAALSLVVILGWLRGKAWTAIAAVPAVAGLLWSALAAGLIARALRRPRERVAFYEDRVDVNREVTRLSEIASVREEGGRVVMADASGRVTRLPEVAAPGELLAWFKTRLPPDRILS